MPEPKKPVASNTDRGLERHVNPDDPTGPLVETRPDMSKRTTHKTNSQTAKKQPKKQRKSPRK